MKPKAIDANVLLRFLAADHPEMSPRCRTLIERVQNGVEVVFLPEAALSDTVWTLRSFYRWPAGKISLFVGSLLALEGIKMQRKELFWSALGIFENHGLDFSDALIAAEMEQAELTEIYSYDRDFDRLERVERLEP